MKRTIFALAFVLSSPAANAIVIDFESAVTGGCQVTDGGSVDGFTLGAADGNSGGGFNNDGHGPVSSCELIVQTAHSGTNYMLNFNTLFAEFTRDVGTFTLNSLYVHADSRFGDGTVRFQGLDGVGGNLLYSMDVAIGALWQQVSFVGWTGVKTFTWDPLSPNVSNVAIDDFEYDAPSVAVPEPATLSLLGAGLVGFGLMRRRRRA